MTTAAGTFTYRMTRQEIVSPKDVWIVNPTPDATVTPLRLPPSGQRPAADRRPRIIGSQRAGMTARSCRQTDRRPGGTWLRLASVTAIMLWNNVCAFGRPAGETGEPVENGIEVPVTQPAVPPSSTTTTSTPRFASSIVAIDDGTAARLSASWRPGCPVPLESLRLVTVTHWGFDRRPRQGEVVVHSDHAEEIRGVFAALFAAAFPIEQVRLVDDFGADDDRSMAANNTSGFNCRRARGSARWSEHAYGRAVDINPVQNPYLTRRGAVLPPGGREFIRRDATTPGVITDDGPVVAAFTSIGWRWGGAWSNPDYQHFSASGR